MWDLLKFRLEITFLTYVDRAFENLQIKNTFFSKNKKSPTFPSFRSELKSEFKKTETTENCQLGWILNYFMGVSFLRLLLKFFRWKNLWFNSTFWRFQRCWHSRRIDLARTPSVCICLPYRTKVTGT